VLFETPKSRTRRASVTPSACRRWAANTSSPVSAGLRAAVDAALLRGGDALGLADADQAALQLGERPHDLHETDRVRSAVSRSKTMPSLTNPTRTPRPVSSSTNAMRSARRSAGLAAEGLALADVGQTRAESGPVAVLAAGLVLEELVDGAEVLAVEALVGAGDAAVADDGWLQTFPSLRNVRRR
jgi:hypothetical protein